MSTLAKRFAAIVACVAVIGVVDTAESRANLAGGRASAVLMHDHAGSAPAELGVGRALARLLASAREQRLDGVHPAITGSPAAGAGFGRGVRVGRESLGAFDPVSIHSCGERGPPSHVRS